MTKVEIVVTIDESVFYLTPEMARTLHIQLGKLLCKQPICIQDDGLHPYPQPGDTVIGLDAS